MLILATPPPYGGGEILGQYLWNAFEHHPQYALFDLSFHQQRSEQGKYSFGKTLITLNNLCQIVKWVFQIRPEVVYVGLSKNWLPFHRDAFILFVAKWAGAGTFGVLHGTFFRFLERDGVIRALGLALLKQVDVVGVQSSRIGTSLLSLGLTRVVPIPNGAYVPSCNREQKVVRNHGSACPRNLLYIGALAFFKGVRLIIEAIPEVIAEFPDVRFHFAGMWTSEVQRQWAENFVSQHNLWGSVEFHGQVTGAKKWDLIRSCDVLLHPTSWDSMPLSILEAMGCGLAIISTEVGGIPDIVHDGINGLLLAERTSLCLAEAICSILSDPDRLVSMQHRSREIYLQTYTERHYCQNMQRIVETLGRYRRDEAISKLKSAPLLPC